MPISPGFCECTGIMTQAFWMFEVPCLVLTGPLKSYFCTSFVVLVYVCAGSKKLNNNQKKRKVTKKKSDEDDVTKKEER